MDYGLSEHQEMLKKTAREFLANECPKSLVRKMQADDTGYAIDLWRKMGEMGWMALPFPEKYGGTGGSFTDLIVLLEEMGRACLPGPFFSTVVLGGMTVLEIGDESQREELLPNIADGKLIVTLALFEPGASYNIDQVAVKASNSGDSYIVSGTKYFVPDANISNYILCTAKTPKGVTLFLVDSKNANVKTTMLKTIAGDKQCEVVLNNVRLNKQDLIGKEGQCIGGLENILRKAAVAKCAEMVGGAQKVLEMTVDYVKDRKQFGVAVGTFQAVQHHCANMLTYLDTSRFLTYKAAWMMSEGLPCAQEVSKAKAWVSDGYQRIAQLGHQCIGGVAFMEDHDMPFYSKRAKAAEVSFGDSDFHREVIAQQLGL